MKGVGFCVSGGRWHSSRGGRKVSAAMNPDASWDLVREGVRDFGAQYGVDVGAFLGEENPNGVLRPANTKDGSVRLFGRKEEDIRVTLYRDPAYWCPYCQRMTLQLEHKRIPYRMRMINMRCYGPKPEYYLEKVPSGLLPAVELNGKFITESVDIMFLIESSFPEFKPLLPEEESRPDAPNLTRALMSLERDCFGLWCQWMFRPFGSESNKRAFRRGLDAWSQALEKIDRSGPFLLGAEACLVDLMAIPFFERYTATAVYWKGFRIREEYPAIDRWMAAFEDKIEAFRVTKADFYSTVHDIPPQYGNAFSEEGSEEFRRFVDGLDGSWTLPVSALDENYPEEDRSAKTTELEYRIEAAASVARNAEKIARFALRGIGKRPRTVTAPLADPDATPGNHIAEVEHALRLLILLLISGDQDLDTSPIEASKRTEVATSLAYMRDRIGVPRDMSFGSARQLRAHINRFNEILLGSSAWEKLSSNLEVEKA
ncbi:hypothetical protein NDN08_007064 [Rhodosorus marinus]|uniref:GST N-terminal domain-containing protein n=1 Tax=Rhodosorus marinus TaxID=101924 RepID=A0AAV8UFG8_9RHOD|nr:hypothetical protein NDN08_007064 [Rhodosorus marinus]